MPDVIKQDADVRPTPEELDEMVKSFIEHRTSLEEKHEASPLIAATIVTVLQTKSSVSPQNQQKKLRMIPPLHGDLSACQGIDGNALRPLLDAGIDPKVLA